MSKQVGVRLDDNQIAHLEEMVEHGVAANTSEALRQRVPRSGEPVDTPFRQAVRRLGDSFGFLGVFLVGLTLFGPMEWRVFAFAPFISALVCYAADRVCRRYEPRVTGAVNRLARRFGRGGAA